MPDPIDDLFATAVAAPPRALPTVQGPPQPLGDDIDDLFGTQPRAAAAPGPSPLEVERQASLAEMAQPSAINGVGDALGRIPARGMLATTPIGALWDQAVGDETLGHVADRALAGKEAAVTSQARGVAGVAGALGLADPASVDAASAAAANAARNAEGSKIAGASEFAVGLAPWMMGPAGMALGATDAAGNRRLDVLDQGGSEAKADIAGLVDGALSVVIPKVLGRLIGPVAERVGGAVAARLGPEAGRVAADAVHGTAAGAGLAVGSAAVSAGTGEVGPDGRPRWQGELASIPKQAATLGLLGAGHSIAGQALARAPTGEPVEPAVPAGAGSVASGYNAQRIRELGGDPAAMARQAAELAPRAPAPPAFEGGPAGGGAVEQPGGMTPADAAAEVSRLFDAHDQESAAQDEMARWRASLAGTDDHDALARELNRSPRRADAGPPPLQGAEQAAPPRSDAAPTNAAPIEPAVPAPQPEVPHGQEVQGQAASAPLLTPELTAGAAVDVRAGRQFHRGEVLSTSPEGLVNVRLADGRTLTGVQPHRVIPVHEEAADAGRGADAGAGGLADAPRGPAAGAADARPAPVREAAPPVEGAGAAPRLAPRAAEVPTARVPVERAVPAESAPRAPEAGSPPVAQPAAAPPKRQRAAPPAPADAGERFMPAAKDPALKNQQRATFEAPAEPRKADEEGQVTPPPPAPEPAAEPAGITDFGEKIGGARKDLAEKGAARPKAAKPKDERPAWARRYEIGEIASSSKPDEKGKWSIRDTKDTDRLGQPRQKGPLFATREEAEAAIPLLAVLRNHRVRQERGADTWAITRDVTDRKRVTIKGGFHSEEEANRYLALHARDVIETETGYGEEVLAKPESVKRVGAERRTGDVGPKDFTDAFGFRGVEFGNWNNQAERREVMNHAYDALHDLADVVGLPPRALSLNGELALAFGARGHGLQGARAHYEHEHAVINLTKMKGAGALAHEWWHALDHYLGRVDGKASSERVDSAGGGKVFKAKGPVSDMVSHGFRYNSKARPELIEAHKRLMETIQRKAEQYVEDTQQAERFVGKQRDEVDATLRRLRDHLAKQREYGQKKAPATTEQLARFDAAADRLLNGEDREVKLGENFRRSNESIDQISDVLKEVTGRQGRNAEQSGDVDRLALQVTHYAARMKMLEDARAATPKEKKIPTQYLRDAKEIDQGRASDYWTTEHELVARAFSSYVEDKLAERGGASDFLSFGSDNRRYALLGIRPFPEGQERVAIDKAFDQFLGTVKHEQTPEGNTRLFAPERVPGEEAQPVAPPPESPAKAPRAAKPAAEAPAPRADEPLKMPDQKEGIESLIAWALRERERGIADLKKLVAKGGGMTAEHAKDLAEHEAVSPEDLARDMREFPQHYLRLMTERGGNMTAVGVYRNRVQMPPQQPRVQVKPLPLTDGEAPDLRGTLRDLRDGLKKAAPSAPTFDVDRGALPDQAGGQYDPRTGAIVTRYHNDLDLVAHEVGHWASETYKLLPEGGDRETRAELARFAVHGSPARGDAAQREGMAEFLRAWMVNPGDAETRAPRFAQRMREKVPPKVLDAVRGYGDSVRRFEGASALEKMAAGQQRTTAALDAQRKEGRWYTPLWQGVKEFLGKGIGAQRSRAGAIPDRWKADVGTKARFHLTDKEAPQLANYLTALELVGRDAATMTPSEHWDFLRKSLRGVAAKVRDGVSRFGLPNPDGTVAKDPQTGEPMALPWLLDPAPKDANGFASFLDRAHAYGSAQRTLELAERFTAKTEDEISAFADQKLKEMGGDRLRMDAAERVTREFAEERRRALRIQLARLTAAGGGLRSATEVARDAVAELESDPQRGAIEEYLRRYRGWADWNLQYAVDAELMSPNQAETIRQANQFYIDWHRVFADDDGPVNLGEAVQGSSRTMHNPLASLMHSTWGTITRGDRNRALQAFVAPLRMAPAASEQTALSQLGRQISDEAADLASREQHGYHDDGTGQKQRVYHTQRLVQEMNADGSPVISPDGTPVQRVAVEHWTFDPATEASLEAMRAESGEDPWTKITQGLVNLQRLAITSAPGFRYKVPVRDNIERLLNTEAGSTAADALRGMRKTLTDPLTGEELDIDRLYHQSGAGMAGWNRRTREQALADVFAHVEDMRKQGYRWLTPGGAWRAWQHFGEVTENIARKAEFVAAFRKARTERGYNQLDASLYAMTQARGLLDTAESGRTIGRLNRFFLFLNASVKGLERNTKITRAAAAAYARGDMATGHRLAGAMAVRLGVWGASLAGLRLAALALLSDDKQEELLEQPSYKRDFAITVPDFGLGKIAIPKPYEWGFIGSGFERLADAAWATGKASQARAAGDEDAAARWSEHAARFGEGWTRSGVTALLPVKFDDVMGGGLAPITEVGTNQSFFTGAPIIPPNEAEKRLELRERASEASLVGRGLSKVLAPVVGDRFGDPRAIDHLLRGYLGGWGTTATGKDFGEVLRRFTGYSGETSPYAERDTRFVLDWAAEEGVASKKPFADLRKLLTVARDAEPAAQDSALVTARRRAQAMRRTIEANPTSAFGAESKHRAKAAADD